jgi:endonuclease YncB( thermonuclease family)
MVTCQRLPVYGILLLPRTAWDKGRFIMRRKILSLPLFLIFLLIFPCLTWAWSGKVVGIADGDTITALREGNQQVKIRLYGIDCPERYQPFSRKAKQFISEMVFGKEVEVEPVDIDRYNRLVALVTVSERLVNEELLNAGFAWVYTRYCVRPICEKWRALESEAREARRGLWADPNPIPPWEFRRKKRE